MSRKTELSTAYARLILRLSELSPDVLLEGTGWTQEQVESEEYLEWEPLAKLFKNYAVSQESAGWTADLGAHFNIATHGPLGFASLSAPTLGEAMDVMATYYPVRASAMHLRTETSGGYFRMIIEKLPGDEVADRWLAEILLKILEVLISNILGHPVGENVLVRLCHPSATREEELRAGFDAHLEFEQKEYSIAIPAAWRLLPSPLYDEPVFRANIIKCREVIAARGESASTTDSLRNILRNHFDELLSRDVEIHAPPTLEEVAVELHITPRTLIRRLKRENSAYRDTLETLRREYAESLLKDARLTVAEIGEILGYREPANFGRAFRRWYGTSPAAWRRQ